MDTVIEVKNLKKIYDKLEAVKNVSFAVEKGEIFGILGPNGAGKTTTLEIIECLKQQTSGTVTVLGLNNIEDSEKIKKLIGVQLQSSQYLHHLSLGELLDLFASLYGQKADRKKLLSLVGLEEKETEEVANLSGGQKQRFTIATALVHTPEILFLDEPTTGLDPSARRSLWQLIKDINNQGITIVMTTHYMEEAELLCNRVAIMDSGEILEIDEPKKLIDRHSQTVQTAFFTDSKVSEEIYKNIPGVLNVRSVYPQAVLELSNLDKLSPLVEALKKNNISFYGFTVKTASLEDVYLKLTGKQYQE